MACRCSDVGMWVGVCVGQRGFDAHLQASTFGLLRVYKSHISIVLASVRNLQMEVGQIEHWDDGRT